MEGIRARQPLEKARAGVDAYRKSEKEETPAARDATGVRTPKARVYRSCAAESYDCAAESYDCVTAEAAARRAERFQRQTIVVVRAKPTAAGARLSGVMPCGWATAAPITA